MAKSKKMLSGAGWSFEPSGGGEKEEISSLSPDKQKAKVAVEKRPKGKVATVVSGFILSDADRRELAATLKKKCGSGGSDSVDTIEVQGEHRNSVSAYLSGLGWRVK